VPEQPTHGVCLIAEDDLAYDALGGADNMELSRALTAAATTSLGGGFIRFRQPGQLKDWTLRYDEFIYVLDGQISVLSGGTSVLVKAGQGCLIAKGTTVTYQGAANTRAIYVLHPIDWDTRN
jgi:ethanolamine utilization protein EutQ (cupin superfamily)